MGQGEDQMEIGHRQELGRACLDPALLGQRLAFRAVAVAAGVVTRHFCVAVITHFQMATEGRRTAVLDGLHHAALWRADPMRTAIGLAVFAEDVRELQPLLALIDADRHAVTVDVRDLETCDLADPKPGAVPSRAPDARGSS